MWYIPYVPYFLGETVQFVLGILCVLLIVLVLAAAIISDILLTTDEERDRL